MCKIVGESARAGEPITVYKVVRVREDGRFISLYQPYERDVMTNYKGPGKMLVYTVGKLCRSPSGPGLMAYSDLADAYFHSRMYSPGKAAILRCTIPADAQVAALQSFSGENNGWAASEMFVEELVR